MTKKEPDSPHTLRSLQQTLGISRNVISALVGAGFVSPSRGPRREYRFTFQDVVLLRTAYALQAAKISRRKILRSLQKLKATLPDELPLSGLRITAVGGTIAVCEGDSQREAESGQLLMDFGVAAVRGSIAFLEHRQASVAPDAQSPLELFARGVNLEGRDNAAAEAAYRRALSVAPAYADAYLNLGALLCEEGRCDEAVVLYEAAREHCAGEPLVHFNGAIALEDQGRLEAALASYARCLTLAPDIADAHYNAGRLHEQIGNAKKALRHFSAYRRLQR